jgi:hypothetical protein
MKRKGAGHLGPSQPRPFAEMRMRRVLAITTKPGAHPGASRHRALRHPFDYDADNVTGNLSATPPKLHARIRPGRDALRAV